MGSSFCCSWSGGKDSCLALYRALQSGGRLDCLVTMFTEGGERSRSHGLSRAVLEAHAAALDVPLLTAAASWADYETGMVDLLQRAASRGVTQAVFGDIDIERHREWEEHVCRQAGIEAQLPLWQTDRMALLEEWWAAGFEATIVVARDGLVDRKYLGRVLDRQVAEELTALGVDACGENGEFHTVVTGGPIFREPLQPMLGQQVLLSGCWFQDLAVAAVRNAGSSSIPGRT